MAIEKSVPENGDEVSSTYRSRFKLACWMIEHMDRRRASIRGRTTVLLTANAALLAGVTFLLARALSKEALQLPDLPSFYWAIGASAVFLVVSMLLAVNSIISLWINPFRNEQSDKNKRSDKKIGLFFHAHYTYDKYKEISEYEQQLEAFATQFQTASPEDMMNYALRYLFDTTKLFDHRYQILRYAVFCFVLSTVSLFVAIAIMIFKILNLLNC